MVTEKLEPIANIKGDKGDRGPTGTIARATATTVPPTAPPQVTMTGSEDAKVANFFIPRGPQGIPGPGGVTTDAAVAGYVGTEGDSETKTAVRKVIPKVTGANRSLADSALPAFRRLGTTPAVTVASTPGLGGVYWPSVVRAADYLSNPIDHYYMYVSTDHATGAGGIYLLTAPHPMGPWTYHSRVFVDSTNGFQTETPDVMWIDGEFDMLYQQQNSPGTVAYQATYHATSPDGINWTKRGVAIDADTTRAVVGRAATLHTGYQRRHRVGNIFISRGMISGGDNSRWSLWFSDDGKTDWYHSRRITYGSPEFGSTTFERSTLHGYFFWKGEYWGYGAMKLPGSGTAAVSGVPVIGRVTSDFAAFSGKPFSPLVGTAGEWESADIKTNFVFVDGDRAYMYYVMEDRMGIAEVIA